MGTIGGTWRECGMRFVIMSWLIAVIASGMRGLYIMPGLIPVIIATRSEIVVGTRIMITLIMIVAGFIEISVVRGVVGVGWLFVCLRAVCSRTLPVVSGARGAVVVLLRSAGTSAVVLSREVGGSEGQAEGQCGSCDESEDFHKHILYGGWINNVLYNKDCGIPAKFNQMVRES